MDEAGAEIEQVAPPPSVKETAIPSTSWEAIRNSHQSSKYSELYEAYLERSHAWQAEPRVAVEPADWKKAIDAQVADARSLLGTFQNPDSVMEEQGKIFAFGKERPPIGKDTLTRLYVGVDPRHATDAYKALLTSLEDAGVLKDIDVALNVPSMEEGRLAGNTIIIYEPSSRPEVLNKVLASYNGAKLSTPDAFALTPRQKDHIMRFNFDTYKATVDANLAFVEIPAEDFGDSYDGAIVNQTKDVYNFPPNATEQQKLDTMKAKETHGVVWTKETQAKIRAGSVKSGEVLEFKRKMSAPALVQTGTIVAK